MPVTIITGSADRHATLDDVKAVAARVPSGPSWSCSRGQRTSLWTSRNQKLYRSQSLGAAAAASRSNGLASEE